MEIVTDIATSIEDLRVLISQFLFDDDNGVETQRLVATVCIMQLETNQKLPLLDTVKLILCLPSHLGAKTKLTIESLATRRKHIQ